MIGAHGGAEPGEAGTQGNGLRRRRNPELGERRRSYRSFRMCCSGGHPLVRDRLRPVHVIACDIPHPARAVAEKGADIFPNDLALRRDLKEAPIVTFIDQCIAIWQPSRAANKTRLERPAGPPGTFTRIFPDDFLFDGIDLQYPRSPCHG